MPALTTRLSLYLPGGGSLGIGGDDEVADIDRLNENFQKIDSWIGAQPVESTNRPSDPFPGQIIQETDTGDAYYWDNEASVWAQLKPHVGTSAPANPQEGYLWVDTN